MDNLSNDVFKLYRRQLISNIISKICNNRQLIFVIAIMQSDRDLCNK